MEHNLEIFMKELKQKTVEDLAKLLDEKREFVRSARFDRSGSSKKEVKGVSLAKKEIARLLTEMNARTKALNK